MTERCAYVAIVGLLLALVAPAAGESARPAGIAETWVAQWGDTWWERYHRDYSAYYPGGRTNRYHDLYVAEALRNGAAPGIAEFSISKQQYLFDGDWYVVEWVYESTQEGTGRVQRESTVAFGRVVDDHLKVWIEYFDDMVGEYQGIGALPLYADDEEPYPWPAEATLRRDYRP